jgi:hypothetical protein
MTTTAPQTPDILAFIEGIRRLSPTLIIDCDVPATSTGSYWIDIRSDENRFTVEWSSRLGFGFSDDNGGESSLFGTPSQLFISKVEDAISHFNCTIISLQTGRTRNGKLPQTESGKLSRNK